MSSTIPKNTLHEQYWTMNYPTISLIPMMGLVKLIRERDISKITIPVLFLASSQDEVADIRQTERLFTKLGSQQKRMIFVENSNDSENHVIAGDIRSPNTTKYMSQTILNFIHEIEYR